MPEEFPQKNEWEEDNFQNDFQNTHDEQIGKLNEVHPPLTPQFFMQERQDDVSGKNTQEEVEHFTHLICFSLLQHGKEGLSMIKK